MMGRINDDKGPSWGRKTTQIYPQKRGQGGARGGSWGSWSPSGRVFWTTLKLMRQVKDDLGASKELLEGMLRRFGVVFVSLGRILAPSWGHLGVSWAVGGSILEGGWGKLMDILDTL